MADTPATAPGAPRPPAQEQPRPEPPGPGAPRPEPQHEPSQRRPPPPRPPAAQPPPGGPARPGPQRRHDPAAKERAALAARRSNRFVLLALAGVVTASLPLPWGLGGSPSGSRPWCWA